MTSQEQNTIEQLLQRKEYLKKKFIRAVVALLMIGKCCLLLLLRTARCSIGSIKRKGRLLYMMVS